MMCRSKLKAFSYWRVVIDKICGEIRYLEILILIVVFEVCLLN